MTFYTLVAHLFGVLFCRTGFFKFGFGFAVFLIVRFEMGMLM